MTRDPSTWPKIPSNQPLENAHLQGGHCGLYRTTALCKSCNGEQGLGCCAFKTILAGARWPGLFPKKGTSLSENWAKNRRNPIFQTFRVSTISNLPINLRLSHKRVPSLVIRHFLLGHLKLTYSHFILRGFSICRESVIREKDFHTIWRWDLLFALTFAVDIFSHDKTILIASFWK